MIRIQARKLLSFSTQDLWDNLKGDFVLIFQDGELVTNERETIYSSYIWDYHREFPQAPLLMRHHVKFINGKKETGAGAHLKLINNVYWDVYDQYVGTYKDPCQLTDKLSRMGYAITNTMFNELSTRLEEYVTSLDITDFIAITRAPDVEAKIRAIEPTQAGMDQAQKLIIDTIENDPRFKENPLAVAIRTGIARMGQALQCLGPRGFLTDMDSNIFEFPIMSSYIQGIRTLYDSMIETRSAAKSLINSEAPLKSAEYFSRRQQLICQNVRHLHHGDCGSQNYLLWPVRDVRYEGTTKISDGDLKTIAGKFYLDDETGKLKVIKESDTHLLGKTIKMRSVVAGCKHPDPYGVCMTCYGEVGLGLPSKTNLGHVACVSMTAIIGQLILSTKHFDGSSKVEGIVLKPWEKQYLNAELNGNSYFLSDKLKSKKRVLLRVAAKDAPGLPDIKLVPNTHMLNITRTSEFRTVGLFLDDGRVQEYLPLDVCVNVRCSSFTHEFLDYAKRMGFRITEDDLYEFDMSEWDYKLPIFVLPMSHFNMSDHQSEVAKMLETTKDESEKRTRVVSPQDMIVQFHDLVNRRLQVNLSVLEVVLYASMAVKPEEGNYALPKAWTERGIGAMRLLLLNRSLSAQMAYQNHRRTLIEPISYISTNRMDHLFDLVLMPEVFNDHPNISG